MISFAGSDSPSTWQGGDKRKRRWLACELACEQALLFKRAKRASPERASEGSAPRGFAARSCVLARLASLAQIAQIGELARRLAISSFFYPHLPVKLKRNLIQQNWSLTIQALKINQETEFGTHKKPMFILFVVIVFFYYIFTRENNMLFSHVRISPLLWLHNKSRLSQDKTVSVKWFGISLVFI